MTEDNKPVRVQRKRTKGWRMPENTVYVGRGSKWGNPFKEGDASIIIGGPIDRDRAVGLYREMILNRMCYGFPLPGDLEVIRGKNLACWCKLGEPCHADFLLELANK